MLSVVALGAICEVAVDRAVKYADEPVPYPPTDGVRPTSYHPGLPIREDADGPKPMTLHFSLTEFADLSDGRRVNIRDDRGFSGSLHAFNWDPDTGEVKDASWRPGSRLESLVSDPWRFETLESLTRSVVAALEPDDDQEWYEWVVVRLGSLGIEVDPASVEAAPYRVEFCSRVLEELEKRGR
ncbi:MAG: hypothetical protein OXF99_08855 [bacterium]|nr:hypothetical protein [bacterium]